MLIIESLTKSFDSLVALDNVSLSVNRGETLGLLGPNGSGKTTLLSIIATLSIPESGTITLNDKDLIKYPQVAREIIGFMPAEFGVPIGMSIGEYMNFFGMISGLSGKSKERMIDQVLELTDLKGREDVGVKGLSTGNKQRLLVAKTLLNDPDLLILDEPSSGLDPRARTEIRLILKELAEMGKTIIISSHILEDIQDICSHVCILEEGRQVVNGAMEDVLDMADAETDLFYVSFENVDLESIESLLNNCGFLDEFQCQAQECELVLQKGRGNDFLQYCIDNQFIILSFGEKKQDLQDLFISSTKGKVT
ncbi:MAG: ABC transporter ATP-binding protein [Lentisphaeria bacterium]|nr:ABC transporter ATP-binding protein [Lentisphaeria bacterium]NQZ70150.1 ABC transporter ATP-binding protein [Lentisphaeria bacterium]